MSIPLSGVRAKINRAKKHLDDIDASIKAFLAKNPFDVVTDLESHARYEIYRFTERESIPIEWGAIVGDCIHNLRSAFDLLANDLVRENGATPTDYTSFPIGLDEAYIRTGGRNKLAGASAAAIELVLALKPYKGGNDAFYRLHRIDIVDKHLLLIPVAAAQNMWGFKWDIREIGKEHYPHAPPMLRGPPLERKFPLKNGDILGSYDRKIGDNVKDYTEFDFGFEIAFGEGHIFDGEPVIPTLNQLIDFTERTIDIFARRIFGLTTW